MAKYGQCLLVQLLIFDLGQSILRGLKMQGHHPPLWQFVIATSRTPYHTRRLETDTPGTRNGYDSSKWRGIGLRESLMMLDGDATHLEWLIISRFLQGINHLPSRCFVWCNSWCNKDALQEKLDLKRDIRETQLENEGQVKMLIQAVATLPRAVDLVLLLLFWRF